MIYSIIVNVSKNINTGVQFQELCRMQAVELFARLLTHIQFPLFVLIILPPCCDQFQVRETNDQCDR